MNLAVFLLSAAVLAHEVCLLRALAIAHQGHAASFVVSVALVGFGAAGTLLAMLPRLRRPGAIAGAALAYAVLVPLSLHVAARVDFNVLELGWSPPVWAGLLALQATFLLPFIAAALGIWIALSLTARRPGRTYAANLLGSGVGALVSIPLLRLGPPETLLAYVALLAAVAAAVLPGRASKLGALLAIGVILLLGCPILPMSPFKDLPATPQAIAIARRYGPLGRVDRVASPALHEAAGLSLLSRAKLPPQDGLFVDGHRIATVDRGSSEYLDDTVLALPFALRDPEHVVLLQVGPDLARADLVVDADRNRIELAGVNGVVATPRAWLDSPQSTFDVLLLHLTAGDPIQEEPLFTVESFRTALDRAGEDGLVAVGTRLTTPPRPGLKVLALADAVTPHVIAARSFACLGVVLLPRPPTEGELARAEAFCRTHGFDLVRPLALRPEEPSHATATPLVVSAAGYPYDVRAPTDARPYIHRTFRWSRIGSLFDRDAVPYVPWAFVVRIVGFLQVVLLGLALLLVPLLVSRSARAPAPVFLALGLAYMLLEMAFLSQATLRLGGPAPAAAAVLGGFLVGSGLGSLAGEALGRPLKRAALAAALLALPALVFLPGSWLGIALVGALVAFPMGMPFPAALSRLDAPSVPWAFAVNGCASVAAAAGAPLLSTTWSIPATAALAACLYLAVALLGGRGQARAL